MQEVGVLSGWLDRERFSASTICLRRCLHGQCAVLVDAERHCVDLRACRTGRNVSDVIAAKRLVLRRSIGVALEDVDHNPGLIILVSAVISRFRERQGNTPSDDFVHFVTWHLNSKS